MPMNPLDLNIRHLRAVAAIARSGSITSASRVVNLTQPAITQGIAKIERQLGVPLFERRPAGMEPTEAALMLVPRIEAALRLMDAPHATAAQISAFLAVARSGGYAAAAVATGLSEPSLHRAVGDLSLVIGQSLVERRGKGIVLTSRGIQVARGFRLAEAELRSALAELAMLQGREVGKIVVGAMPLSRARLLPSAVAEFHRRYPGTAIAVVEGSHTELVGPLRDGEIDVIVGALRTARGDDGLISYPLFEDRPVVIGRAGHPLARAVLTPQAMAAYPWITAGRGTPLRAQWEAMFEAVGVPAPDVPIECGAVIMIRQILRESDFLTLLSPDQVAVELEAEWLAKIADAPGDVARTIGFTTRADWRPTPLQKQFLDVLQAQALEIASGV